MTEQQGLDPGDAAEHGSAAALYRDYAEPLRRYVRSVAASRGLSESLVDTEGVVHEAFAAMLDTHTTIADPPAWLFTVARRLVGKTAAQHKHRAAGDPQQLLHSTPTRWTSLTARASTEDITEARQVMAGISELPDRQKAAVYLRHVQGWSAAEVSAYLQCAPATAHVHIHRGKQRLRIALLTIATFIGAGLMMTPWQEAVQHPCPGSEGCPVPPPPGTPDTLWNIPWSTSFWVFASLAVIALGSLVTCVVVRRLARHHVARPSEDD